MTTSINEWAQDYIQYLITNEMWLELQELKDQIEDHDKYNKLLSFIPYEYQLRFMKAGAKFKQRLMRSGNQTGKSYGASFEFAMHLTGQYQDYYEGERITTSDHTYWCIGIDLDSTARVMQKALFGTANVRLEDNIGTGAIPQDAIDFASITKDGGRIVSARIKHVDGGYNTLQFFGAAQGADRLMGSVVKGVWIDEEPKHNSMEIYSQCLTRTTTTDGFILMTATPEMGYTALQRMFAEDETGHLHVDSASWDECPHITEKDIARLLAGVPAFQHDMRRKGLPVLGSGAVFPFLDDAIMCEDFEPAPHWQALAALDFSSVHDASVIAYACHDQEADIYYIYHVDRIDEMENKNPKYMAKLILEGKTPRIPTVSPHDGGVNSVNPESKAKVMRDAGVNILSQSFYNPPELSISFSSKWGSSIEREPGLTDMRRLFEEGRLKIARSCVSFFREKGQFFYSQKAGGGLKTVGEDDTIDACRYAIVSLRGNRGIPHGECYGSIADAAEQNGYVIGATSYYDN